MPRKPDYNADSLKTVATREEPKGEAASLAVEIKAGRDAGKRFVVGLRAVSVGRAETCEVRLTDPTVSSFHVELAPVPGGVAVRDLGSRNGTIHAGARLIHGIVPVGAVLALGAAQLRVTHDAAFSPPALAEPRFGQLVGQSRVMRELFSALARLSATNLSVMVEGPTGTGKELVARALHDHSPRARGPFVVLDCTAIPASLAESTLFGHQRGAFTGASEAREGAFEAAHGGTIFLDEIGELSPEMQPKLLRVLERREVVRVGGTKPKEVDVRVVCATWRDLRARINDGSFREDLYYRLAQARVVLPALVDRRDDIPLLVQSFLDAIPEGTAGARAISPEALAELSARNYPGNVRELRSTVVRAAMLAEGPIVRDADLAFERFLGGERSRAEPGNQGPIERFKDAKRSVVDEFERDYLARLLQRTEGNISRAAAIAGLERHHLRELCRRHGLREPPE